MSTIIRDASKFKNAENKSFNGIIQIIKPKLMADGTEIQRGKVAILQTVKSVGNGGFLDKDKRPGWITGDLEDLKELKVGQECPYEVKVIIQETTDRGEDTFFQEVSNPQTGEMMMSGGKQIYRKYVTMPGGSDATDTICNRDKVNVSVKVNPMALNLERTI